MLNVRDFSKHRNHQNLGFRFPALCGFSDLPEKKIVKK